MNFLPGWNPGFMGAAAAAQPASFVLNGTDEVLRRVLSTSGPNTTIFTVSAWVKSTTTAGGHIVDSVNRPTNTSETGVGWGNTERLELFVAIGGSLTLFSFTNGDILDITGAWNHYVYRYDSTQGTAANRSRLYKNGSQLSDTQDPAISLNEVHNLFTNGHTLEVGNQTGGLMSAKSLAFIDVLEGVSAAPTAFAFDNGGTWTRMPYAGSYGTYGFSLDGTDGFNDVSGNGQHFTGVNMDASNLNAADLPPYTV